MNNKYNWINNIFYTFLSMKNLFNINIEVYLKIFINFKFVLIYDT